MTRINSGAPVVDTHGTWSLQDQFGVVEKAWIDAGTKQCRAKLRLSQRDEWKGVVNDIKLGIIRNISVGYMVYQYEVDESENNPIPVYRAIDWEPAEISFVPVPADYNSGSRSKEGIENDVIIIRNTKNSNTMTPEEKAARDLERKRSAEIVKACRAANLSADFEQSLIESDLTLDECRTKIADESKKPAPLNAGEVAKAERSRISDIRKAVRVAGLDETFAEPLIEQGIAIDAARAQIIDEAAKKNPVEPKPQSGVRVNADEKDKKVGGMESCIMQRAGVLKAEVIGDPGQFRGMTMMDLAKECLTMAGINYRGMTQMEIAGRALQMTRDGGGGLATGDFSYILQNVMNKTLRAMYELQGKSFTGWSRKTTATDFKNMLRTQLSDVKLTKVQEGGEYQAATISDSGETYKVAKYGKIVNIDWETIVNDDLNAFSRVPTLLSGAVAQLQGDIMYGILTGNPTMGDGVALFDVATHANLTTGPGTAITVASLGLARKQFRQQKSPGGSFLNLAPKYLIVGPAKEMEALQYTSSQYVSTKSSDINVWIGLLTVIVDARITDNSWFLAADPGVIDTAEYATLEGQDIYSETKYGFEVDALQYKVRTVFGGKAIEWRSFYKNVGA